MKKTKVMVSSPDGAPVVSSGNWPCSICSKGVGSNSIFCRHCKHWVHKRCSGVSGSLNAVLDFKCKKCTGEVSVFLEQPELLVVGEDSLESVDKFCYLGDMISAAGGAGYSSVARIRSGWKKFRELLPLLTSRVFSHHMKGRIFEACVRSVMLYGSETWAVKTDDLTRMDRNDMRMIRWMCGVTLKDRKPSEELRDRLGLAKISDCVQSRRLRWFGHVERMQDDNWVKKSREIKVTGRRGRGRPRKTWEEVVRSDLAAIGRDRALAQNRVEWKRACRQRPPSNPCQHGTLTLNCL